MEFPLKTYQYLAFFFFLFFNLTHRKEASTQNVEIPGMQNSPVRARTAWDPGAAGRWKSPRMRLYAGARSVEAGPRGRTM